MGFLTLGGHFMNQPHDILDDRIDVVTRGLLGLTGACARSHEHKFDPTASKDYYSLYGVFASSAEPVVRVWFAFQLVDLRHSFGSATSPKLNGAWHSWCSSVKAK